MRLTIKAEVSPGCDIENAFIMAVNLAKRLDCTVEFDFNGVTCLSRPEGDISTGVAEYHRAIQESTVYKIACA